MSCIIIQTTIDDQEKAYELANKIVGGGLAACVHIHEIKSVYHWQGKLENAKEFLLQAKTTADKQQALMSFIKSNHSYDLPEIIVLPITGGSQEYLSWVEGEVKNG